MRALYVVLPILGILTIATGITALFLRTREDCAVGSLTARAGWLD